MTVSTVQGMAARIGAAHYANRKFLLLEARKYRRQGTARSATRLRELAADCRSLLVARRALGLWSTQ
jgi:hypothetical protein